MKKFIKVVKIILITLLVLAAVGYAVLYVADIELARSIVDRIKDFIDRPLPIIGGSVAAFGYLVYKIFTKTIYGKKYLDLAKTQFKEHENEVIKDYENHKNDTKAVIKSYEEEINLIINAFCEVCASIPNVKVQQVKERLIASISAKNKDIEKLEEKFNGKETVNSNSKEEKI